MFKARIWAFVALLLLPFAVIAHEIEAKPTTIAVYIQAQDYNYQLRLHHYSTGYWYSQGPILEEAAMDVLGQDFKEVAMCDDNPASAKVLIWLRPRMFYNPQVQTFYGKVIAYAYTADGKPIANFVGENEQHGFLDIKPELHLQAAYRGAIEAVSAKMQADAKVQQALKDPSFSVPCATKALLPEPKIQFMGF
jgi:hypothetical protein